MERTIGPSRALGAWYYARAVPAVLLAVVLLAVVLLAVLLAVVLLAVLLVL
jgi:hypothetical protein